MAETRTPEQSAIELAEKLAAAGRHAAALGRDLAAALDNYARVSRQRDDLCNRVADYRTVVEAVFDKRDAQARWQAADTDDSREKLTAATGWLNRALVEHARKYPRGVR